MSDSALSILGSIYVVDFDWLYKGDSREVVPFDEVMIDDYSHCSAIDKARGFDGSLSHMYLARNMH